MSFSTYSLKQNSNTTNVKVKFLVLIIKNCGYLHSNTTNVKVKCLWLVLFSHMGKNSNTTNVKVKLGV